MCSRHLQPNDSRYFYKIQTQSNWVVSPLNRVRVLLVLEVRAIKDWPSQLVTVYSWLKTLAQVAGGEGVRVVLLPALAASYLTPEEGRWCELQGAMGLT